MRCASVTARDLESAWAGFVQTAAPSFESPFERAFVERVLTHVAGLTPALLRPQQRFSDGHGKRYRMDFAIIEEPFVHIALEVDGYDKRGTGTGMTRVQFEDWLAREAELKSQGWHVLRFANSGFTRAPLESARFIELTLREARAVGQERALARGQISQSHPDPLSVAERSELLDLRVRAQEETRALRAALATSEQRAATQQAENSRMIRVALALSVVFAAALIAVALIARPAGGPSVGAGGGAAPVGGTCPSGYPIKGNVTQTGTKIYHLPGGEFYGATRPERCFSTEMAAQAEGFRASQR